MAIKKIINTAVLLFALILVFSSCEEPEAEPRTVKYTDLLTMTSVYPHRADSFTQGLFFHNGEMFETAGLYSQSALYKNIDLESGTPEIQYRFDDNVFTEGSVVFDGKLYALSWKENKVFVFNPDTLELEKTLPYNREGWGLTSDGEHLIASDGSSSLYFMDKFLNDIRRITVTDNGKEVTNLNELEFIDGCIWANIWLSDKILIIDKDSGEVKKTVDFSGMHQTQSDNPDDVMNGIAYNPKTKKVYITGKRWDSLYEFEIK